MVQKAVGTRLENVQPAVLGQLMLSEAICRRIIPQAFPQEAGQNEEEGQQKR